MAGASPSLGFDPGQFDTEPMGATATRRRKRGNGSFLLVVMFFPWYRFLEGVYVGARSVAAGDTSQSAWQAFSVTEVLLVLVAVLGITQLVTTLFDRTPAYPVAATVFTSVFGEDSRSRD